MGGFGEDLGRVWGGFWEGLGALWTLQGLFSVVSGLCWALLVLPGIFLLFLAFPGLSQPFLAFAGLCWPLLGFNACYYCWGRAKRASKASERSSLVLSLGFPCLPMLLLAHPCFPSLFSPLLAFAGFCWVLTRVIIAGGERSERAKRASEALWCFLWVSLAYPCFCWRTLAFSCFLLLRFFACCLAFSFEWYLGIPSLMLYSVFGCSLPCFVLSRFTLCQHFLKKIALPVHLLRQVYLGSFFRFFFRFFF